MLSRMDSREISEEMAYDRIEPPDLWPSTIARLLYWLGCQWAKKPPPFADFLPRTKKAPMGPAEMRARLRGL